MNNSDVIDTFTFSGSVECTSWDFSCVYSELCLLSFISPKINKRGAGIRARGLENFSKVNKRGGGDDYFTPLRVSQMLKTLSAVRSLVSDQDENESFVDVNKYLNFGEKRNERMRQAKLFVTIVKDW